MVGTRRNEYNTQGVDTGDTRNMVPTSVAKPNDMYEGEEFHSDPESQAEIKETSSSVTCKKTEDALDIDAIVKAVIQVIRGNPGKMTNSSPTGHDPDEYYSGTARYPVRQIRAKLPKLPQLKSLIRLTTHIRHVETLLAEDGIDCETFKAKSAFIETLIEFPNLYSTAIELVDEDWSSLIAHIGATYANPTVLRRDLEERIRKVQFNDDNMGEFVNEARALHGMLTIDMDKRWFCEQVFKPVPRYLLKRVIEEAHRADPMKDWKSFNFTWLLNQLSDAINMAYALNDIRPAQPRKVMKDRVLRAQSSKPATGTSWLDQWAQQFKSVWYLKSPDTSAVREILKKAADYKTMNGRSTGGEYYFVAFASADVAKEALARVEERSYRPFSPTKPKN